MDIFIVIKSCTIIYKSWNFNSKITFVTIKISASIFAQNQKTIDALVTELQKIGVTVLHVDWKGEADVIAFLEENASHLTVPLDVHLIHAQPQQFFSSFFAIKPQRVCLQFEEMNSIDSTFFSLPTLKGMAITSQRS